jgi:(p)ppGpp synthase/HD superfamily hydrolase
LAALRGVYAPVVPASLLLAFDRAAQQLLDLIERWLPGRAVHIAAEAHLGQFDRGGVPYIYHPLLLALQSNDADERMVALLHDVLEDSAWTIEQLRREGFSERVLDAVCALTRLEHETYEAFIERVAKNELATRVKLLDLKHNSDLSRLPEPNDADRERVQKYQRSIERLQRCLDAG